MLSEKLTDWRVIQLCFQCNLLPERVSRGQENQATTPDCSLRALLGATSAAEREIKLVKGKK